MTEFTVEREPLEHADELRRASDEFMQRLLRLYELETHKRELRPDAPEFVRLAREERAARAEVDRLREEYRQITAPDPAEQEH